MTQQMPHLLLCGECSSSLGNCDSKLIGFLWSFSISKGRCEGTCLARFSKLPKLEDRVLYLRIQSWLSFFHLTRERISFRGLGWMGWNRLGILWLLKECTWEDFEWPEPDFETELPEKASEVIFELIGFGLEGLADGGEIFLVVNLGSW